MDSRLTLSNRRENLKLLMNYVRDWARERSLSPHRRRGLEKAVEKIFHHLVTDAYQPGQPGSITVFLEENGPRLRLAFEDDAAPNNPGCLSSQVAPDHSASAGCPLCHGLQHLAESLI